MFTRSIALAGLVCIGLVTPAWAQVPPPGCSGCLLEVFDQPEMLTNYGDIQPFSPKYLYLGIRMASPVQSLAGIEFSIAGLRQAEDHILIMSVDGMTTPPPGISAAFRLLPTPR